jgi:hypothetical protein
MTSRCPHVLLQMPEYIAQAVITAMLLLTGKWVSGLAMAALTAWNVRTYLREEHRVDVTEVFRQIPREKNIRIAKLVFYLLGFVYFIYRRAAPFSCSSMSPCPPSTRSRVQQQSGACAR